MERAARAGLQHCPQCRAQGRDRRGQARTHILKHTGVPHLVQRGVPLVNGPTVCRAPGLPFYLVLRRGIDRAGGQSHFRPVLKTFQSRGECQISPDMALGTTGLNPAPEGLNFGVLSNFSQSGSTVYLSSAPGVSSASQPRSPCTSWGPHEGRRTCGLRRWYDFVNHHGELLLLPETLIATSARPSIPALS